ncbi:uncharacterized protein LOC131658917 [Vicia villosa]|uniref:uncharacterized protein LOC131658917 n=1 Tax=Vicia villosa TaxID=3911 RepID=UPI00273C0310|nr:uncharacterized protein LOC131658917 [Vicia villosa]
MNGFLLILFILVEKEWKSLKVEGRGDYLLKEKFRHLKDKLRRWNKEVFGKYDLEMEEGVRDINVADERLESDSNFSLSENLEFRKETCRKFWRNLRIKENMILQKSRVRWINEGDSNIGFFHKVMKQRRRHNHIGLILNSGEGVESVEKVREAVWIHFRNKFVETEEVRPLLDDVPIKSIGWEEACALEKPFLENENKEAVWECGGEKSPGRFSFWGVCIKWWLSFFAWKLKHVLNSIISPCQSAFVPGRQLLDKELVENEVVDYARKEGSNCILFKVDFEKAYDKVLVNGSPTKEFVVSKGLRQGDPLSPFLYVLVAEGLTDLVKQSIEVGEFQRFSIKGATWVDILQFADDTLIVGDGCWKHVWTMNEVLRAFKLVSGLGINFHKSKLIGINSNIHFLEAASQFLSCRMEERNFYFLGIPISFNPRKEAMWNPLFAKMKNRLEGWTNRFLNLGGRITLLKSVLSSLDIFSIPFYKMPLKVAKKFTCIQSFYGGGWRKRRNFIG